MLSNNLLDSILKNSTEQVPEVTTFKYCNTVRVPKNSGSSRPFKTLNLNRFNEYTYINGNYVYEYIKAEDPYKRLLFDLDSINDPTEFNSIKESADKLSTLFGRWVIGGYTESEAFHKVCPLPVVKNAHHPLSAHLSFPDTCLSNDDYKLLMNPNTNAKFIPVYSEDAKGRRRVIGYKLGDFPALIDKAIYSGNTTERLLRHPISDKEDSENGFKRMRLAGCVLNSDFTPGKNTDCLMSTDGHELIITLNECQELGIYEPVQATRQPTSQSTSQPTSNSQGEYDRELSLVKLVLSYLYTADGDKDESLGKKVIGIAVSGMGNRYPKDTLKEVFYEWWNTDKDGNEYKHNADTMLDRYVDTYYDKPSDKYEGYPPEVYIRALIKQVPDKEAKKFLRQRLNETFKTVTVIDKDEYHQFDTITYHSEVEIQSCRTADKKLSMLCECVRYDPIKGVFYTYIQETYAVTDMKAEHFKLRYLPAIVGAEGSIKLYNALMSLTALRGIPRIGINDICRHNPMDDVVDESPHTRQSDIECFYRFFNKIFKDESQEVRDYVLKWIAVMIQAPGSVEVAIIILSGLHGTGKSLFCKVIAFLLYVKHTVNFNNKADQAIFSPYTSYEDTLTDHTGKFNGKVARRKFSGIQELDDKNDNTPQALIVAGLKRLTDPMRTTERKGIDSTDDENICQIMIGTNSKRPIPIEHTERRYLAVSINKEHKNDRKYWAQFYNGFSAPYFIKHLYDHFKEDISIEGFNEVQIPRTELLIRMMLDSLTTVNRFVCVNYTDCVNGLNFNKFSDIISNDNRLLGKYGSAANLWKDYLSAYDCELSVSRDGKHKRYFPSDEALEDIEDIQELYAKMYAEGAFDETPIEFDDDGITEEAKKDADISNFIDSITKVQESKKGNYQYILNSDIPKDRKVEVVEWLTNNEWTIDKHLGSARNLRGYKKSLD